MLIIIIITITTIFIIESVWVSAPPAREHENGSTTATWGIAIAGD